MGKSYKFSASKRLAVYLRDKWTCQYCGRVFVPDEENLTGKSAPYEELGNFDGICLEIDHILPRKHGGGNEVENLRAACTPCNKHKSAWLTEDQWTLRFAVALELLQKEEPSQSVAERVIGELIGRRFHMREVQ
jgi:5-methylcytosine-specific restriction endonuclease McrA